MTIPWARDALAVLIATTLVGCSSTANHVGKWRTHRMTGTVHKELRAVYLDLDKHGTFIMELDSPDMGSRPHLYKGRYHIDGESLTFTDEIANFGIKSARIDGDEIRLHTGAGFVILNRRP